MGCSELLNGLDVTCIVPKKKYYQQVVLVNLDDVDQWSVYTDLTLGQNNCHFNLKTGKTGYLFRSSERQELIGARFSKRTENNIDYYEHSVALPIVGVTEEISVLLRQLDGGEYFAAVQFTDGTVQIFGYHYGLKASGYTYDAQNNLGGTVIELVSDHPERYPPFEYIPKILVGGSTSEEQANEDFNTLFAEIDPTFTGDFNNDFNNDFYITN